MQSISHVPHVFLSAMLYYIFRIIPPNHGRVIHTQKGCVNILHTFCVISISTHVVLNYPTWVITG